ncbi:MAG: hypothetical protein E7671_00705 [Ruminococcaceae bacterium]|nr:hypothetical protein [Oscillospiraceae bacterium]
MKKISVLLVLFLLLSIFVGCRENKVTISEEFYKYATDTINIINNYLNYVKGYSYQYMDNRLMDLDSPELPPFDGIDEEIRSKEVEIWSKVLKIHVYVSFHEENPNTRDHLKEAIDELQKILDGVVVGEVIIDTALQDTLQ